MLLQCAAETWNVIRAQFAESRSWTLACDARRKASSTVGWWGANVTTCCTMLYVAVPAAVVHSTYGQVASALCSSVTASAKCLDFTIISPHLCRFKRVTMNTVTCGEKKNPGGRRDFPPAQTGTAAQIASCTRGTGLSLG